jgi:hypothetical protein
VSERRDEPVTGDVIENGAVRAYSWEWSEIGGPADRRSRLPWFGIFLVVFGALLLLRLWYPALETAGSLLFLAVGVAFLVSWLVNRGMGSLYLGAIIVALAAPDLLVAAGVPDQAGLGTLSLGVAFLFIALVRALSGAGAGWQAGLGTILALIGISTFAISGFSDIIWPIALLALGGILLVRASSARR